MDTFLNDLNRKLMIEAWNVVHVSAPPPGPLKEDPRHQESSLQRFWRRACNR